MAAIRHSSVSVTVRVEGALVRFLEGRFVGEHDQVRGDQDRRPVPERAVAVVEPIDKGEYKGCTLLSSGEKAALAPWFGYAAWE